MCAWLSSFLLNAFVSLVKRLIAIRIVRFARSAWDVLTCFGAGLPVTFSVRVPTQSDGL